jgi:hypothetical protein
MRGDDRRGGRRRSQSWDDDDDRRQHQQQQQQQQQHGDRRQLHVAADVAPRAGVVSDDEDGNHLGQQQDNPRKPPPIPPTSTAVANSDSNKKRKSSPNKLDDTIGHYNGREGSVIADRYRILKEVGVGTFGRVLECVDMKQRNKNDHHRQRGRRGMEGGRSASLYQQEEIVAIKVVRNVKRYYDSALIEADIIEDVNRRGGRGLSHCAIMYDAFTFHGHYCMVFESLGPSLYDFLKRQQYQPFPISCVRDFARQLLEALEFLHSFSLIHTDLKPENVLLLNSREVPCEGGYNMPESTRIKVIDFGGATYDSEKKSSIVNTRQYRAPEVILGVGWSMPSDLWSIGEWISFSTL